MAPESARIAPGNCCATATDKNDNGMITQIIKSVTIKIAAGVGRSPMEFSKRRYIGQLTIVKMPAKRIAVKNGETTK